MNDRDLYSVVDTNVIVPESIDCIAVGLRATAIGESLVAFGDDTVATEKNPFVIGTHVFGQEIPDYVRVAFQDNPEAMKWIIRIIRTITGIVYGM